MQLPKVVGGAASAGTVSAMEAVYDSHIRIALRRQLAAEHAGTETLIVDELGVCHGAARVDVATVNGAVHGFEIKSAYDSLVRLGGQADVYARVCDELTLVCAGEHLDAAIKIVPRSWGVIEAVCTNDGVSLVPRRKSRRNRSVKPEFIVQLLWRDELVLELAALGRRGWSRQPVHVLEQWLVEELSTDDLAAVVRARLRSRPGWPAVGTRLWESALD